ncbi:MAG: twin-arginine translocase subunit TatB [Desulfobacterium sp.]|nr:twin-arginine translocase subunit TatB [Desulfobacterium sp.]MBU3946755.1 Sec-independent protein translocase protein TatB [Pseudomonadota bacterium]MBU4036518.1 Sec-independent protein translocase protein TatB [Pseudomonadota bacterium]
MLDVGMPEFLLIAAIALIVVGPDKLPDIAKTIGRMFGELKKTTNEFKQTMEAEIKLNETYDIDTKEIIDKAEIISKQDQIEIVSTPEEDNNEQEDKAICENESCLEKEPAKGTTKDERG